MSNPAVADLVARSNRLGADPRNTNYAGGNTSAKGTEVDPVTGEDVELLWVKGSGGDLGTLTEAGLAVLRLDRVRALVDVYPGIDREDEMVAAFDYCLHGKGGAAPSIDTAMHGLVDAPHVDHLHPDSGIAIATADDGEKLTEIVFGDKVVWVPWRRPGFQLGMDIAAIKEANPQAVGCVLGGHGITAWGRTSEEAEQSSLWIIETAAAYIEEHSRPEPFGPVLAGYDPLPAAERRAKAAALAPTIRSIASQDRPMVGHFTDSDVVLDFLARAEHPRLAELGTSCPDHFLRTKVKPLVLDLPAGGHRRGVGRAAARAAPGVPGGLPGLLRPARDGRLAGHPRSRPAHRAGARRGHVQLRQGQADRTGRGRVLRQRHQCDARCRGTVDLPAYRRGGEVPHRVLGARGGEAAAACRAPKPLASRIAFVTGAASGHREGDRAQARGRGGRGRDRRPQPGEGPGRGCGDRWHATSRSASRSTSATKRPSPAALDETLLAFGGVDLVVNNAGLSLSKSLLETTVADWDLQHAVMARGSFLVSRTAAKVLIEQGLGGDIVYISSKNSVFAGPNNIAYSATKADQAHQVRLLAAELGEHGVRVNGINPDGVVQGSGIFAGGWGANRAAVYGVEEKDLGKFYAQRTHPQARGAAGARRERRLRTGRARPHPDHRAARAGRRRRRRGVPAVAAVTVSVAAVDLGASSGRVMVGEVGRDLLRLHAVARFGNEPVRLA